MKTRSLFLCLLLLFPLLPERSDAYLDPNTGGFFFSLLFPVYSLILALFVVPRRFLTAAWNRLATLLRIKRKK